MLPSLLHGRRQLMAVVRRAPAARPFHFPLSHVCSNTETQLWSYFSSQGCGCQPLGSSPWRSVNTDSHQGRTITGVRGFSLFVSRVLCRRGRDMAETLLDITAPSRLVTTLSAGAGSRIVPDDDARDRTCTSDLAVGGQAGAAQYGLPDRKQAIHPARSGRGHKADAAGP